METAALITGYIGVIITFILCYVGIPFLFFATIYLYIVKPFISLFRKDKSLPATEQRR